MASSQESNDDARRAFLNMDGAPETDGLPEPPPPSVTTSPASGRRVTSGLAALVVLVGGVVAVRAFAGSHEAEPAKGHPAAAAPASSSPSPAATSNAPAVASPNYGGDTIESTSPPDEDEDPFVPLTEAANGPEARRTSTAFVTAVLNTKQSRDQWAANLAQYATTQYARDLAHTDPADIPAQQITGPARVTHVTGTGTQITVLVPTSAGGYTVQLGRDRDRVAVTHAQPAGTAK